MRTITIQITADTLNVKDDQGQAVNVRFKGGDAWFTSLLIGDEVAVWADKPIHRDDAEMQALFLLGFPGYFQNA